MQALDDSTLQQHLIPLVPRRALGPLALSCKRLRTLVQASVKQLELDGDGIAAAAQQECHLL